MNEGRHRWFVANGLLSRAEGDPEGALRLLNQAEQLYRPGFYPDVRPIAALRARVWIAQGNLAEAEDWASERGVSVTEEVRYLREFDHLTLVRLLLARHRAHQEIGALDQATDSVGPVARGRTGLGTRRRSPRDRPAEDPGPRRAGTSVAGSGVPGPRSATGA